MKKKVFISLLSAMLIITMAFSTNAFAVIYTIDTLPYGVQTEPQQERKLESDKKDKILQKLLDTEYQGSNPDDIVIRYYGSLSNGAMLINHYNKTYDYPVLAKSNSENRFYISFDNVTFCYSYATEKDMVNLYINGEFYTFKEAYDANLISQDNLWEIDHYIDDFCWYLFSWADSESALIGDLNGDGKLTVADATLIQKYICGAFKLTDSLKKLADTNSDGNITVADVTEIQNKILAQ